MKWLAGYRWLVLLLAAVLLAASYRPWGEALEGWSYRALARVLPSVAAPVTTAVVALDADALASLGPWPWSASQQAALLDALAAHHAAAIGWLLPLEAAPSAELAAALRRAGRVVVAQPAVASLARQGLVAARPTALTARPLAAETPAEPWRSLAPLLRPPASHWWAQGAPLPGQALGVLTLPAEGEVVWRAPLAVAVDGGYAPSLALALIMRSQGLAASRIGVLPGQGLWLGKTWLATDAGLRIYPRPAAGQVPVYSAAALLAGRLPKHALRGKTVLVGATAPQLSYAVTAADGASLAPVTWSAQVLNALQNRALVDVPFWSQGAQRGALLLVLCYLLLLPGRLRGRLGLVLSVVLALLLMNTSLLLLLVKNTWLPLGLPALLLVLGHGVVNLHHRVAQIIHGQQLHINRAYAELAANLRGQGQLDPALAALRQCSLDGPVKEALYDLGLDFERRRQFAKALEAYDLIAAADARFRDIKERRARHQTGTETVSLATTRVANPAATTLVVDDPRVARPLLGRYEIERELGRGAMGTVYLGRDPRIGRTVAIKTLALSEEFESKQLEEVRRRFFQEAETAGRLDHPNIVTIYDVGEEHDLAYIAMDYIQGESLDRHVQPEQLLPLADVFGIGVQVAEALDYAHGQKVVHRDVKPGNIIYDRAAGRLKVTDFGIACLTDNSKTRTGTVLGSPFYMSPEQIAGQRVDGRADLYSLGVTLYQLLSGRLPFEGDSLTSLMYKIANDKPQPIRKLRRELPACVTRFINKALDKDPARRYAGGASMAEAIKRCAEQSGVGYRRS
jgi:CHASE2 domain-containing sensor protein/tRNA A-37 threonylcarbamoyl transferase component Bud32